MIAINDRKFETNVTVIPFKMNVENVAQITETLAERLYSNPIPSIVREITSNALDATVRAKVNKNVIVSLNKDANDNYYFSVQDSGTGMDQKTFENFVSFGASDKRGSNDEYGYYGLGSKSPFAYNSLSAFFVITVNNKRKYTYTMTKVESGYGYMLNSDEPTDSENGTLVYIPISNYDRTAFKNAMLTELRYFGNVSLQTNIADYSVDFDQFNKSKFLNFNNFLYFPQEQKAVFVLNGVRYPINFDSGFSNYSNMPPIAVKLPMDGSVMPIPSREMLNYSDSAKAIMKAALDKAIAELSGLIAKQLEEQTKSLSQYLDTIRAIAANKRIDLFFGEYSLPIYVSFMRANNLQVKFNDPKFEKLSINQDTIEAALRMFKVVGRYQQMFSRFNRGKTPKQYRRPLTDLEVIFFDRNLFMKKMILIDKALDRKVNAYIKHENILESDYYMVEFVEKVPKTLETLVGTHPEEWKMFLKEFKKALFKLYSSIEVPDGWKAPRNSKASSDSYKDKISYKSIKYVGKTTETIAELLGTLDGKKLVYALDTDPIVDIINVFQTGNLMSRLNLEEQFMFIEITKTNLAKLMKVEGLNAISFDQFCANNSYIAPILEVVAKSIKYYPIIEKIKDTLDVNSWDDSGLMLDKLFDLGYYSEGIKRKIKNLDVTYSSDYHSFWRKKAEDMKIDVVIPEIDTIFAKFTPDVLNELKYVRSMINAINFKYQVGKDIFKKMMIEKFGDSDKIVKEVDKYLNSFSTYAN